MKTIKRPKFKVGDVVRFVDRWWLEESSEIALYKLAIQEGKATSLERIEDMRGVIAGCEGDWLTIQWLAHSSLSIVERRYQNLKVYTHCEGMWNSALCDECKHRSECLPFMAVRHFSDWRSRQKRYSLTTAN